MRRAVLADVPALAQLVRASVLTLFPAFYDQVQTASAAKYIAEVDEQIIADGTYFVFESGGEIVACGGWSRRAKVHAGPAPDSADDRLIDPAAEPARVRAMFVRQDWTRRGIGTRMLNDCRVDALSEGFRSMVLVATLPGFELYRAYGFRETSRVRIPMPDGVVVDGVSMELDIAPEGAS